MSGPTQILSPPGLPSAEAAWDEAFLRVEGYLRAHRLESRVMLNQIANDIVETARRQARVNPVASPVTLAMQVTHDRIGAWFARTGLKANWNDERSRARGRLALIGADLPGRWANQFLSAEPVPEEFAAAIRSFEMYPGPALQLSPMPAAPLEFAFADEGESPYPPTRNLWLLVRAAGSWLLIAGFFGIAWAASH